MLDKIYLVQVCKKMVRQANVGLAIYLLGNQLLVSGVCALVCRHWYIGALIGVLINMVVVSFVLSPFGEWELRRKLKCGAIDPECEVYKYTRAVFDKAHAAARALDPNTPEQIDLFFTESPYPNAFATGRHTVCVTYAAIDQWDEETLYAVFGHELGHLAHFDTDNHVLVYSSSLFADLYFRLSTIAMAVFVVIANIVALVTQDDDAWFVSVMATISTFVTLKVYELLNWLWSLVGHLLTLKTMRMQEFDADRFSAELGGAAGLLALFAEPTCTAKGEGLFALLSRDHPKNEDRCANIQKYLDSVGADAPTYTPIYVVPGITAADLMEQEVE